MSAIAAPAPARVVLVDSDPELQHAISTALAPWRLELVVDTLPVDAEHARERAELRDARFVVWREGGELVVYDRERGEVEHRAANSGALDPVAAAAAALTVKTLMRLPPPPDGDGPGDPPPEQPNPTVVDRGPEVRVQAGFETRIAHGSETEVGARFVGAALVLPFAGHGLRLGVLGDLGTGADVEKAGFKGSRSDWAVLGIAGWTFVARRFEIEPYVAAGVTRSELTGTEMMVERNERDTLAVLRGGVWVRWRYGMWSLGGVVGCSAVPGTPTYTRMVNDQPFYEVPSFAVVGGIVIAADLGR